MFNVPSFTIFSLSFSRDTDVSWLTVAPMQCIDDARITCDGVSTHCVTQCAWNGHTERKRETLRHGIARYLRYLFIYRSNYAHLTIFDVFPETSMIYTVEDTIRDSVRGPIKSECTNNTNQYEGRRSSKQQFIWQWWYFCLQWLRHGLCLRLPVIAMLTTNDSRHVGTVIDPNSMTTRE